MFSHTLNSTALAATLFIAAAVLPSSLRAQRSAVDDRVRVAVLAAVPVQTARMSHQRVSPVGISRIVQDSNLVQSQDQGRHMGVGPNLALMGTGGAAVVIGLLVGGNGGTAIALGGGVLGLVGFYRYLR